MQLDMRARGTSWPLMMLFSETAPSFGPDSRPPYPSVSTEYNGAMGLMTFSLSAVFGVTMEFRSGSLPHIAPRGTIRFHASPWTFLSYTSVENTQPVAGAVFVSFTIMSNWKKRVVTILVGAVGSPTGGITGG